MAEPTPGPHPPASPEGSARGAWIVLGVVFTLSTLLGLFMFRQYSAVLTYVKATLDDPDAPPAWVDEPHSVEDCVDAALQWASECNGIKTLCDIYVERVVRECLDSRERDAYCIDIADVSETTEFGVTECRNRGVRRDVDKEACANAYRTIDTWCEDVRYRLENPDEAAEGEGESSADGTADDSGAP